MCVRICVCHIFSYTYISIFGVTLILYFIIYLLYISSDIRIKWEISRYAFHAVRTRLINRHDAHAGHLNVSANQKIVNSCVMYSCFRVQGRHFLCKMRYTAVRKQALYKLPCRHSNGGCGGGGLEIN